MEKFLGTLKRHIAEHPPNYGDGESVLTMLYECHNENNPYDNEQIRADFNELYQQMNGMPLRDVNSGHRATLVRSFSHSGPEKQPHLFRR